MIDFLRVTQRTYKDLKVRSTPHLYVYYPTQRRYVNEIFRQAYQQATMDRDENWIKKDFNIKLLECVELTDTAARFLIGKEALKNFTMKVRKKMSMAYEQNERNRTRSCYSHARLMSGVKDRIGVVGRPGS